MKKQIMRLLKKLYRKLFVDEHEPRLSAKQYTDLSALKCIVSYNRYGGYCVPESSRHRPAAVAILSNSVWEPQTIDFIGANCANGDIVHAGAYFGDFLPALSKAVSECSKVFAFEPNHENYRCAAITIRINDLNNVMLTNAGLGDKKSISLLQTADIDGRSLGGASRIVSRSLNEPITAEEVQIVTIDDSIASDRLISIIQLDVEGHEEAALSGALGTIRRCLPIIILEVLPNSTLLESEWFSANILSLGYSKLKKVHANVIFVPTSVSHIDKEQLDSD